MDDHRQRRIIGRASPPETYRRHGRIVRRCIIAIYISPSETHYRHEGVCRRIVIKEKVERLNHLRKYLNTEKVHSEYSTELGHMTNRIACEAVFMQ